MFAKGTKKYILYKIVRRTKRALVIVLANNDDSCIYFLCTHTFPLLSPLACLYSWTEPIFLQNKIYLWKVSKGNSPRTHYIKQAHLVSDVGWVHDVVFFFHAQVPDSVALIFFYKKNQPRFNMLMRLTTVNIFGPKSIHELTIDEEIFFRQSNHQKKPCRIVSEQRKQVGSLHTSSRVVALQRLFFFGGTNNSNLCFVNSQPSPGKLHKSLCYQSKLKYTIAQGTFPSPIFSPEESRLLLENWFRYDCVLSFAVFNRVTM